jgi:DNA gyrase subunit A
MAARKSVDTTPPAPVPEIQVPVDDRPITDVLEQNFMPYAMSVIVSRAIPEIDGFKPSHRKLLYTMYKMGLLTGARTKSANVVGQTMKLNPHGDQAIYETLVRLTRGNGALLHAYIDSKGNFGKQYSRDMAYAASRYTEVKLDRICEEVFRGLDRNAVDFIDNYDGSMKEPALLPATFPTILVNANQGIAVGMASNICSFNLSEICRATAAYIRDPAVDVRTLVPAPDFETGAEILMDEAEMAEVFATGRGAVKLRARYEVDRKLAMIEIIEIPYTTTVEAVMDEIAELIKSGKVKEIADVRDETDLDGMRLTVEYRRSVDPDALMLKLFRYTSLQTYFSCNFNILVNGTPRVMGVKGILAEWVSWRQNCVRRETRFEMERKEEKRHLLEGLERILLDIDRAVKIVRESEKESDVVPNLMAGFEIDEDQAESVAEIRLRNLNREYILARTGELRTLQGEIDELRSILANPMKVDNRIVADLDAAARKYGKPRRTRLIAAENVAVVEDHHFIDDFNLKLFLTAHGYVKKIPMTSLRANGEIKTKEDDRIVQEQETRNKADVLFFTDRCNCYKIKAYELPDHKPSDLGDFLTNRLELEEGEKVIAFRATDDYAGQVLFAFENGKVARADMKAYETKTNRKRLKNAYSDSSPLVAVFFLSVDEEFVATSSIRKVLVFNSSAVPMKAARDNQGVQILLSKKGSRLLAIVRLAESGIQDPKYYRTRTLPAVGSYLKEASLPQRQLELGEVR